MAKSSEPPLTNCKPKDVFRLFEKLGDFTIKEGAKHTKVTHTATGHMTTVPRHTKINRLLLKNGIIKKYLIATLEYKSEDIFKHISC